MCGSRSESNTSMTFWPISIRRSRRPCPCKKPREGKDQGLAQSPPLLLERAMPIILPSGLPAATELEAEGYDVRDGGRERASDPDWPFEPRRLSRQQRLNLRGCSRKAPQRSSWS